MMVLNPRTMGRAMVSAGRLSFSLRLLRLARTTSARREVIHPGMELLEVVHALVVVDRLEVLVSTKIVQVVVCPVLLTSQDVLHVTPVDPLRGVEEETRIDETAIQIC